MNRRHFLQAFGLLGLSPGLTSCLTSTPGVLYPAPDFGNVTLLHITDCHAQLLPVYYREPSVNKGPSSLSNSPPHLTGQGFLDFFGIKLGSREAYAFTHLDFAEAAAVYGKMGGFAQLATLIKQIKQSSSHGNFLLLDGGDTWQGSATSLWTQGADMLAVCNLLGVDVMTGHWEFTYGGDQVKANIEQFKGDFVAQNVSLTEEAQFVSGAEANSAFKPYVIKEFNNARIAIIGQAYPYTPIANPKRLVPDWQFGIQEQRLQQTVNKLRQQKSADVIILLSHNGMDVDLKLAARVSGIDVILGGHTHDAIPKPIWVQNNYGKTCVANAGSHGKFVAVLDLDIRRNRLHDLRYRLLPVFSNLLEPDAQMQQLIDRIRQPFREKLQQPLGVADKLLYRRDTYKGTFDQLLLDALLKENESQIALSPGFRWGTTLLPGQVITYEDVMNHTAITYPNTQRRNLTGAEIKAILEDAADNVFNPDPYYQQGGDMVRAGGMNFQCEPNAEFGQRISQMRLSNGALLDANSTYPVSSWASVNQLAEGRPIPDVLVDYLKRINFN
ncbi:putative sulfur oxidation protein SoxB [Methyloglobulus morosus KoM1]|uniref:Putative sulfur oxidation protein SoxB n=1 Tax=Methyloglobulus morosus KoM1 TaxID=1116472 RepID=V5C8X2_9GAMM|nr:thiosulfohydrolase SoxB [Methyloglobulus morosus]ESS73183.1 putative sulfur oxidation protein SoxB [Methyloglobulus morosus KoM1]